MEAQVSNLIWQHWTGKVGLLVVVVRVRERQREKERERFWGWGVSLCFFTYLVPSYPGEIGRKMTK